MALYIDCDILVLIFRFSILNRKLCNVLSHSDDPVTLAAVHTIVQATSSSTCEKSNIDLQYLSCKSLSSMFFFKHLCSDNEKCSMRVRGDINLRRPLWRKA